MPIAFAECDNAEAVLPAVRRACSRDLGWRSVLARAYVEDREAREFTTVPTDNLLLVLVTGGTYAIESRSAGRWSRVVYRPGSTGVTAPGNASTLRWTSLSREPLTSLQLYLHPSLFDDVRADRRISPSNESLPDALSSDDPTLTTMGSALRWALTQRASALYADSAAQFLAAHLLERASSSGRHADRNGLSDKTLTTVVDYMHAHLADDVSLDHLSAAVGLSKHHFLRSFRASMGVTPHRYLVGIRMRRAADLLRTTPRSVEVIAAQCGYRSGSNFAAAFRDFHGASPTAYRRGHAVVGVVPPGPHPTPHPSGAHP